MVYKAHKKFKKDNHITKKMKAIQFRKLIREEVRRALKEVAGKAYALVIDEDGNFMKRT